MWYYRHVQVWTVLQSFQWMPIEIDFHSHGIGSWRGFFCCCYTLTLNIRYLSNLFKQVCYSCPKLWYSLFYVGKVVRILSWWKGFSQYNGTKHMRQSERKKICMLVFVIVKFTSACLGSLFSCCFKVYLLLYFCAFSYKVYWLLEHTYWRLHILSCGWILFLW